MHMLCLYRWAFLERKLIHETRQRRREHKSRCRIGLATARGVNQAHFRSMPTAGGLHSNRQQRSVIQPMVRNIGCTETTQDENLGSLNCANSAKPRFVHGDSGSHHRRTWRRTSLYPSRPGKAAQETIRSQQMRFRHPEARAREQRKEEMESWVKEESSWQVAAMRDGLAVLKKLPQELLRMTSRQRVRRVAPVCNLGVHALPSGGRDAPAATDSYAPGPIMSWKCRTHDATGSDESNDAAEESESSYGAGVTSVHGGLAQGAIDPDGRRISQLHHLRFPSKLPACILSCSVFKPLPI